MKKFSSKFVLVAMFLNLTFFFASLQSHAMKTNQVAPVSFSVKLEVSCGDFNYMRSKEVKVCGQTPTGTACEALTSRLYFNMSDIGNMFHYAMEGKGFDNYIGKWGTLLDNPKRDCWKRRDASGTAVVKFDQWVKARFMEKLFFNLQRSVACDGSGVPFMNRTYQLVKTTTLKMHRSYSTTSTRDNKEIPFNASRKDIIQTFSTDYECESALEKFKLHSATDLNAGYMAEDKEAAAKEAAEALESY